MKGIEFTQWWGLYSPKWNTSSFQDWASAINQFLQHFRVEDKFQSAGFGPYKLEPGATRRADEFVECMTLAVFDADQGTDSDITNTGQLLDEAGLSYACYSTFSYPEKSAYRIVVPLSHPLPPHLWAGVRETMIDQFKIPAHKQQCKGVSHFYFYPSARPNASVRSWGRVGHSYIWTPPELITPPKRIVVSVSFSPPDDPTTPEDLAPLLARIEKRATYLEQVDPDKAVLLRKLLAGYELGSHGERNTNALRVAGMLGWMFTNTALSTLKRIMAPSVDKMIEQGSKITWQTVESMLLRGMRKRAQKDEEDEELLRIMSQHAKSFRISST